MADEAVELNVAGQSCRVVTTANERELQELATMVEAKLGDVLAPGRPVTTQAMLLAAVALANDVREQRQRADDIAERAKKALRSLLDRVEGALADEGKERSPGTKKSKKKKKKKKSGRSQPNKRS